MTTAELSIRVAVPTAAMRYNCSVAAATVVGTGVRGYVPALSGKERKHVHEGVQHVT